MVPQQHLVISWVLSNLNYERKRDRIVTTLCGIFPDVDGLGLIIDKITGEQGYSRYFLWHRTFGHNLFTLLAAIVITFLLCKRKVRPAVVAAIIYIVHIFRLYMCVFQSPTHCPARTQAVWFQGGYVISIR